MEQSYKVDETGSKGQFILTGSSTPVLKGILHGGTGRIGKITMRTMSLYEMGKSTGNVCIMDLFNGNIKNTISVDSISDYLDCFSRLFLTDDQPALEANEIFEKTSKKR